MSANEPLPPDHSRKLGITCGAGFANTMRYPKRRRGLKYVKRIAIQTTQTVMLVISEVGPGCPCVSNQGRNGPSLSGGLGGVLCMARSYRITVAIKTMDGGTETMADPLYSALLRRDVK